MAAAFNLTAEINLRGPSNLGKVVSDIRRQLSTVTLDLTINPRSISSIQQATGHIQSLNAVLKSASTNAATLNTALSNLGTAIGNASRGMNNLGGGINNISSQINNAKKNTAQITSQMEEFGKQSALAIRRFAAFSVATGGLYALTKAISSAYSEFLTFNKELVKLQQVTGATENGLKGITNEITRLSTSLGVTSSDLLTVSSTLAQAGLSATETKTALEALAKSALAPSFDNLSDTVEGSIALMRQFGISANDLESSLGSVNAVAAAFAVESGDIIKAIQRTGGVFASASKGVSEGKDALNEFIAVFTSIRQTTRESAETIATGLRTIFTRIQRGSTIEALKEYGVTLTDLEGKFVGPYEAVRRLSEGLKQLDPRDLRFNQIVEELGGFRQIGKVIPLIQEFTTAQQALGVAQRGAGSLAEDAGIAQLSLANKITKVREEFIALIRDIGQSKNFQRFVDISLQLASALINVASAAKDVLPALAALTAIKAIPAISQFVGGFGKGFARKNQGGHVRAFASGGYVPGSGNRDTVPAMLTPGEFVIRKKAVEKIGVGNLGRMNKYAGGGPVKLKDLESRSGASTIKKAYSSNIQPSDRISANINRKSQQVKPNDPTWSAVQNIAKSRYSQLRKQNPKASDKKLKDIAAGDAFEDSIAKSTGGQKTPQSYPIDIIGKKRPIEAKFTNKKTPIIDLISKLFRHRYEQNTLDRYSFTPGIDPNVNIGSLDVMEMGSGQKKQFMKNYPFNMGGIVQKFAKGGKIEDKINKNMKSGKRYEFGLVGLRSGTGSSMKGSAENIDLTIGKEPNQKKYSTTLYKSTLSSITEKKQEQIIERDISTAFGQMVEKTASTLRSAIGGSRSSANKKQQILKGSPLTSVIGTVFEAALGFLGGPYVDKSEKTKSMDFPLGLGKAAGNFGIKPNIPTDATRTIGGSGKGNAQMKLQMGRFIKAVEGGEFTKSFEKFKQNKLMERSKGVSKGVISGYRSKIFDVLGDNSINQVLGSIETKILAKDLGVSPIKLYKGALTGTGKASLSGILASTGRDPEEAFKKIYDRLRKVSGRADGGGITNQDTVPALLTPGEFVINKKAAKKIGGAKLNKLNKADKISGFNKGGAVGNVGGAASGVSGGAISNLTSSIQNLISSIQRLIPIFNNLGSATITITKNLAAQQAATFRQQGLSGGALKAAMIGAGYGPGGINNMRTKNQNNQSRAQKAANEDKGGGLGLGLMFIGPMIAEAINSSITKNFGKSGAVVGSAISSTISGAAIGSALPLGPYSALIGAAAGLAAGFLDAESAANEYAKAQNELTIENQASQLDKAFEKLANKTNITAADLENLGSSINSIISLTNQNQKIVETEAGGGFFGGISRYLSRTVGAGLIDSVVGTNIGETGTGLDTMKLSRDILSNIRPSVGYLEKTVSTGYQQGLTLDEIRQTTKIGKEEISGFSGEDGVTKLTEFDRLLTMSSDKALELAKIEADIADLRSKQEGAVSQEEANIFNQAAITQEKNRAALIRSTAQAQKEEYDIRLKSAKAIKSVTAEIDMFAQNMKKLEAAIGRAGAQFDEASRLRDISTSAGLGEAKIVGPSRLDENVLSNMTAYSTEELVKALDRTSETLGFSPEFTKQIKSNAVAQQTLESELPRILLEAAQSQKTPGGELDEPIKKKIEEVFDPLKAALGDQLKPEILEKALGDVVTALGKASTSLQGKSFEEIASSVPELQGLLSSLAEPTKVVEGSLKAYNDMLNATSNDMNAFTNHLGRILDLQMQASNIELEAANNLQQALGKGVSVAELNRPFENMVDTLTSRQGPRGLMAGTGTLDPKEIGRRLEQADRDLAKAQTGGPQKDETLNDFYNRIAKGKNVVDRLSKAQEMLANNTTRASNALNRIGELRQAQESRRGTFDEILKNLNNPEWITEFAGQVGSLVRVEQGTGTMNDIGPALDAFNRKIAGMDPLERQAATDKFYNNILGILQKAGANPEVLKEIKGLIGVGGPDGKMQQAIDQYNAAINAQKEAILQLAGRMKDSSDVFYNKVIQAAEDFLKLVREGSAMEGRDTPVGAPLPDAEDVINRRKGGIIYANKGRLIDFQPKGTDTVPAMLTPGEFVVNARATKNNMGLLKAINNGSNTSGYSKGGVVYLADGGVIDINKGKELFSKFLTSSGEDKYYADLLGSGSQTDLDAIFKDLRATSERPLGYESLAPEDIESVDAAINEFINNYEFGRTKAANAKGDKTREDRAADAPRLAQLQAEELRKAVNAGVVSADDLGIRGGDYSTASRPLSVDERDKLRQAQINAQAAEREQQRKQEFEGRFAEIEKTKRQMETVKQADTQARTEINPYTKKPYTSSAEKEGVLARQQFEAQQKTAADVKAEETADLEDELKKYRETELASYLVRTYEEDPRFSRHTTDPILKEYIKNRIINPYGDSDIIGMSFLKELSDTYGMGDGSLNTKLINQKLSDIILSATVEYNRQGRARQEMVAKSQEDFAKKNMQTALQQFGEGVDKSPILAAATAVPKNVANVIRTVVGGAGVAAGGLTYGAGKLFGSDFVTKLGTGLMESGGAQAGMGVEGIRQVGAGLGSRLGFGEAYGTAEQEAMRKREQLVSQEASKASGLYKTDQRTTSGQLFTPENVVRGAITAGDVFGEAAGELGGERIFSRLFPTAFKGATVSKTAKETGYHADVLGRTPGMRFPQGSYSTYDPYDISGNIASRSKTYGKGARFAEDVKNIKANMAGPGRVAGKVLDFGDFLLRRGYGPLGRETIKTGSAIGRSIMNPRKTLTSVGRGISSGSDVIEQALMKARSTGMNLAGTTLRKTMDLGGMGIKGAGNLAGRAKQGILKRLGLGSDVYKLQQIKTQKAQRAALKKQVKAGGSQQPQPPKPNNITKPGLTEDINPNNIIDNETQPVDLTDLIPPKTTAIPKITETSSPAVINTIKPDVDAFESYKLSLMDKLYLGITKPMSKQTGLLPSGRRGKILMDRARKLRSNEFEGQDPSTWPRNVRRYTIDRVRREMTGSRWRSEKASARMAQVRLEAEKRGGLRPMRDISAEREAIRKKFDFQSDDEYLGFDPVEAAEFASLKSNTVRQYLADMSEGQVAAFKKLASQASPEKRHFLLIDMLEQAAEGQLKWLDPSTTSSTQLQKMLKDMAEKSGASQKIGKNFEPTGAYSQKRNEIISMNPVAGVHESAHFVSGMAKKLKISYQDLKEMIPGVDLDKFLKGSEFQSIVGKIGTAYTGNKIKQIPQELFSVLNQAMVDPNAIDLMENSPMAKEILRKLWEAHGYKKGGKVVYASNGTLVPYQPKGTDTVPAMLTPGEFVVNAKATKKNMGLLRAINGGAKGYSKGGVAYLQDGGKVDGEGLLGMSNIGEGMDILFSYDMFDKKIEPEAFESAAAYIERGLRGIKKQSAVSPNTIDNQAIAEFESVINSLIQSDGKTISEIPPEQFNAWRSPYNDAYNILKGKLLNQQAPPKYILDDLVSMFDNQAGPQVEAKNEAQAQEAGKKDIKPSDIGTKPTLSQAAKTALDTIKTNLGLMSSSTMAAEAMMAKDNFIIGIDDLSKENFKVDLAPITDILNASKEQILEARTNNMAALQNFYDTNVLPALGDMADQAPVGVQPNVVDQSIQDPYAGMTANEIYKAKKQEMREAYKTNKQSQREAFRSRTGRDPKTGRIVGENKPLTDQEKADNKRRAEIRATKAALGGKKFEDLTEEEKLRLQQAEIASQFAESQEQMDNSSRAERLALGAIDPKNRTQDQQERYDINKDSWLASLDPEQMANRKRAERLALGAIDPKQRTESQQQRYEANKSEFLNSLNPEQIANRERSERMALDAIRPENRSFEQQELLDILKIATDQRSPEQIARLEELRKEKEQALYASKGRLINFQPRGSDTVPAMLTPGEFVVNRKATKQNLGLLQQINSQKYNSGGIVKPKYLANGSDGGVQMSSSGGSSGGVLSIDTSSLDSSFASFDSIVGQLSGSIEQFISGGSSIISAFDGLNNVVSGFTALSAAASLLSGTSTGLTTSIGEFNSAVSKLQSALGQIPDSISLNVTGSIPVNVTVTVNGGQGLGDKLDQFADEIYNTISTELSNKTNGGIKLDLRTSKK